jgi:hypothetical protein
MFSFEVLLKIRNVLREEFFAAEKMHQHDAAYDTLEKERSQGKGSGKEDLIFFKTETYRASVRAVGR